MTNGDAGGDCQLSRFRFMTLALMDIDFVCSRACFVRPASPPAMPEIQQRLGALLGKEVKQIRMTETHPRKVSVIDVAVTMTGYDANYASQAIRNICESHPEVHEKIMDFKFRGRGQRKTPVTDVHGIVEIILLLPGRQATRIRRQCSELLVGYMGGDLALVDRICRNRGLQEELAVRAPDHPARLFGSAVEASGSTVTSGEMVRVCTEAVSRVVPELFSKLAEHIDQRMSTIENRFRVNLNVRAPKRAGPYSPTITRNIAGQPYPIAKFLDEMEKQDPSWKSIRRSFAPTFSMLVQVLKKKQLKESGHAAVYVEQNHRPQLFYKVEDRAIMEEAWELTAAHREDLAGKRPVAPAPIGQSVLALLRRE